MCVHLYFYIGQQGPAGKHGEAGTRGERGFPGKYMTFLFHNNNLAV